MQITRGDSFLLGLVVKVDGARQDLTHWQIRSSIGKGSFLRELSVNFTDRSAGEFTLSAATSGWPLGTLALDVKYTTDVDQIITTNAVQILVVKGVTP